MKSAFLGVIYSLIAVVPLFGANHIVGLVGSFKQNGILLWVVGTKINHLRFDLIQRRNV